MVEHVIGNDEVSGSIPDVGSASSLKNKRATLAQLVEQRFRKAEVPSANLGGGSVGVAQSVEHRTHKPGVVGSIPTPDTNRKIIAGLGFEPRPSGYEPDELPLLNPAMKRTIPQKNTYGKPLAKYDKTPEKLFCIEL